MWLVLWPLVPSELPHWLQTVRTSSKPRTHTFIWRLESINRGGRERELSTAQIFSSQRANRRNTAMAPTITASIINSNHLLPLTNKLRKPIVEKMRRERINSSIEKLKSLLGGEFLKQQPDSRQEKADILEMTVYFLRQQQQSHKKWSCSTAADEGYSRCVQEAIHFLSQCQVHTQSQRRLLSHFLTMQPSMESRSGVPQLSSPACQISSKEETPGCSGLWRPW
ncbi:transcription factor HES-5-like [Pangasianodon hypophthalmus]|uniref:transcription factor HES-5-like n=1 Tax=Pangasianodon hypophthalmus TaxID=310915 RepID=UPI0023075536|nr:transcription factor HES-5-like [Pangasianodon hypophthalmus]